MTSKDDKPRPPMTKYIISQASGIGVGGMLAGPVGMLVGGLFVPLLDTIGNALGDLAVARIRGAARANEEISYKEKIEAANLEKVATKAAPQIKKPLDEINISDSDWAWRFLKYAADATTPKAQDLFAAALAGQYNGDGKTDVRTLGIIRNLSAHDAEKLVEFAGVVIDNFVFWYPQWHRHTGNFHDYCLTMGDLGLILLNRCYRTIKTPDEFDSYCSTCRIRISPKYRIVPKVIRIPIYPVTVPGRQLCRLVRAPLDDFHLRSLALYCKRKHLHQVQTITDDNTITTVRPLGFRGTTIPDKEAQ